MSCILGRLPRRVTKNEPAPTGIESNATRANNAENGDNSKEVCYAFTPLAQRGIFTVVALGKI